MVVSKEPRYCFTSYPIGPGEREKKLRVMKDRWGLKLVKQFQPGEKLHPKDAPEIGENGVYVEGWIRMLLEDDDSND